MSWLRIDADMPWNDKVVGLPNDTARFAFVKALCAAKVRGRSVFTSASLKELMGSHAKAIPDLIAAGLLEQKDDLIAVHDFDEYQRKALGAERQQRHRERYGSVTGPLPERDSGVTETSPTYRTGRNGTYPPTPQGEKTTFMGWKPVDKSHHGQHGSDCLVCHPVISEKGQKP